MFLLTVIVANGQARFNPMGYASSVKDALKEPSIISTVSIYYTRGMIFDVEQGKNTPDEPLEKIAEISNLRQFRLNGCPVGFQQEKFFYGLSKLKQLELVELRMSFKKLGLLSERSMNYLKKITGLKKLNLPYQYPAEELIKLQQLLPNCEIITNIYPEGD
jgi:hypothetical protein